MNWFTLTWSVVPSILWVGMAIPAFALVFSHDAITLDPATTLKAMGHQWYWSYEYSGLQTFDSYMLPA